MLLLDEPLSSLDVKLRKEIQLELRRIHRDLGSTFFYVTHDQEVALTASDRIGVMNEGEIIQVGTPKEVYEEPATPFVAQFTGETNLWGATPAEANSGIAETDAGYELSVPGRDSRETGTRVSVSLRPEQIDIALFALCDDFTL